MMIACISPSMAYFDETLSTIQYAMRTMNIKNKPIIQMETKDQIIYNLNQEIKICLIENQFLRQQINKYIIIIKENKQWGLAGFRPDQFKQLEGPAASQERQQDHPGEEHLHEWQRVHGHPHQPDHQAAAE